MKIAHVIDYIQPQLGYQEYFLAREHGRMGHEVVVIASDRYYPFPGYEKTVAPVLGPRHVGTGVWNLDGFRICRLRASLEIGTKTWLIGLERTLSDMTPDLVICHGVPTFNALRTSRLKKKLGYTLIIDDHTHVSECKTGMLGYLAYRLFPFMRVANQVDRLIAIADECVEVMVRYYRLPRERIEMIPLGADVDRFRFSEELRRKFRADHGISENAVVVTYTGKITESKGPHNLLLAARQMSPSLKRNLTLLFVGNCDDAYRNNFDAARRALNSEVSVVMTGAVPNQELVAVYSASDIAVWPRQASMSMIEAASCNVPIICCDFLAERCKNGNGLLVKEDDIVALGNALITLVGDPERRKEMGRRGRDLVEKELSWKVVARRFLDRNFQSATAGLGRSARLP